MRLALLEDFRGEAGTLTAAHYADALLDMAHRIAKALPKTPGHGSVAALDELAEHIAATYEKRRRAMLRDVAGAIIERSAPSRPAGGGGIFGPVAKAARERFAVPYSAAPVDLGPPPKNNRKQWPHQGTIDFQGIKILVENKRGSYRSGVDGDGHAWRVKMHHHYGEIVGTEGADGDRLDVYVGPNAHSPLAVVVHQARPETGEFDEDKVMLGFDDARAALKAYRAQYDRPGFYGGHTAMPMQQFVDWMRDPANRGAGFGR